MGGGLPRKVSTSGRAPQIHPTSFVSLSNYLYQQPREKFKQAKRKRAGIYAYVCSGPKRSATSYHQSLSSPFAPTVQSETLLVMVIQCDRFEDRQVASTTMDRLVAIAAFVACLTPQQASVALAVFAHIYVRQHNNEVALVLYSLLCRSST